MALLMPNPVMNGVEEDISAFVYKVMCSGATGFADFVAQWQANSFCYIFSKRSRIREMQYFTREILILAKKRCLNAHPHRERIFGVFLLYSLYYIQPLINRTRIRIEHEEFEELLGFIKGESKEVQYCFFKLLRDHAFEYVFDEKLYSLERVREREVHMRLKQVKLLKAKASNKIHWDQLCKSVHFDPNKWLATETTYNQLKSSINEIMSPHANLEMTEFLKPLMTIEMQDTSVSEDVKPAEQEATDTFKVRHRSKRSPRRKKRQRAACSVLFEGSSSSEEEPVGGSGSMPQLGLDGLQSYASDGDS